VAPRIFFKLIKKHDLVFTAPAHVNTPIMLGLMLLLVLAVHSSIAPLFARIVPGEGGLLFLSISAFFASLFLAINRRGAFSQIIGILSAENCLVAIAALMNIHTELWLELGILADIFAWMLIGSTFISVVSKHFGTTDVSVMKELAE
jgi:hydrogenase-4 membrane subunit HyfE